MLIVSSLIETNMAEIRIVEKFRYFGPFPAMIKNIEFSSPQNGVVVNLFHLQIVDRYRG